MRATTATPIATRRVPAAVEEEVAELVAMVGNVALSHNFAQTGPMVLVRLLQSSIHAETSTWFFFP